jgi:CheY-like chemotaxis protein
MDMRGDEAMVAEPPVVLVVDDDDWLRTVLADLLAGEGYRTLQARDGPAGLQLARAHHPDVILLDLFLPKKSGYSVLEELRADQATRDIPIITVSAATDAVETGRLMTSSARPDAVLGKPLDIGRMLAALDRVAA